jgi:hypothetical protein
MLKLLHCTSNAVERSLNSKYTSILTIKRVHFEVLMMATVVEFRTKRTTY